jgi:hypothetical protein
MSDNGTSPKGLSRATPPRSNLTPPGFKNVRVFVPQSLHFQLVSHSAASEMSLQDFVVAWLERATPLAPQPACQRQMAMEQAPGHQLGQRPLGGQDKADVPGAAHLSEAEAASSHDPAPDLATSRSPATLTQAPSPAVQDLDPAEAGRAGDQ